MTVLTEGRHKGEFIVSEANGNRSRSAITVASGQNLGACRVISKLTANGEVVAYDNAGSDGSETAAGILFDAVDATSEATPGVIIDRDAEVNGADLDWGSVNAAGQTAGIADLAAIGIKVR